MINVIVILVIAALVGVVIRYMIREHKAGRKSCGFDCSTCAMSGSCHSHSAKNGTR